MARSLRIQFEGAAYHLMSRGNHGQRVFRSQKDNELFIDTLSDACQKTGWEVPAFVLMSNHYHLLVVTPHGNLVDGMRWLQGTFTQRWNVRHRRRGHLFQGRYKAQNVQMHSETYFRTIANYIHLNPARAGIAGRGPRGRKSALGAYRWVSDRLGMGAPSAVSNAVAAFREPRTSELRRLRNRVERD